MSNGARITAQTRSLPTNAGCMVFLLAIFVRSAALIGLEASCCLPTVGRR